MWHPEGNEPSGWGQSTQGPKGAAAPTETGFLEFSVEDCVPGGPLGNGSVALSSLRSLPQVTAPCLIRTCSGHCLWEVLLGQLQLRDFSVRLPGFKAQLCCLPSGVTLDKLPTSLSLSRDGDRAYFIACGDT